MESPLFKELKESMTTRETFEQICNSIGLSYLKQEPRFAAFWTKDCLIGWYLFIGYDMSWNEIWFNTRTHNVFVKKCQ